LVIDGGYWINTFRYKTSIPVRVPLLPPAIAIIEKYKNNSRVFESGRLLPVYANQLLYNYLKEISDFCSIEKALTFYIARHTFRMTVTLTTGVPIETVSKLLGHTRIKTTQIYAQVIEQKVSEDLKYYALSLKIQCLKNETLFLTIHFNKQDFHFKWFFVLYSYIILKALHIYCKFTRYE